MVKAPEGTGLEGLAPMRLDRAQWMQRLSEGRMDLSMHVRGFSTFPPESGWGFRSRVVPFHILYLVTQGGVRLTRDGEDLEIEPGALFWMAPGVRHDLALLWPDRALTTYHMRLDVAIAGRRCRLDEDVVHITSPQSLQQVIEDCYQSDQRPGHFTRARVQGHFLQLFAAIFDAGERQDHRQCLTHAQEEFVRRFVEANARQPLTPEHMAGALGLSADYFSRRFKASFGASPRVWLVREKMRQACIYLAETRRSVSSIAADLGYQDIFAFSRQFRRYVKCSPTEFRIRHRH